MFECGDGLFDCASSDQRVCDIMSVRRNECKKRPATVKKTGKNEDGERANGVGGQPSSQSAATGSETRKSLP